MSDADGRHPVEQLAEEYVARTRRGERPTIDEYAAAHPEHADDIRELFPAIAAVEGLKDDTQAGAGAMPEAIEQLGDYRIVGEIGRGGMGVVYEAEQLTLGRRVAIKVLPRAALDDASRLARFEREARTAASLHHTNIVPIFGTGESDGHHFFVMQRIRGLGLDRVIAALRGEPEPARMSTSDSMLGSVVSRLRSRDLDDPTEIDAPAALPERAVDRDVPPPREPSYYRNVAKIAVQVAHALAYAHDHKTLHRDIKPANILLDADGTAWITDFGLAKALEQVDLTRSSDVVGTLRYMAPEQLDGSFDERTDIHALGLTLWELLALRPAREGADRAALLGAIRERPVPPLRRANPSVPRDLATIVDTACAAERRDRYRSAALMADDLERLLEDRPIRARRASALEVGWRWCRRNRTTAALAGVAVVAVLAAAAAGWWGWANTNAALAAEAERSREARDAQRLAAANLALSLRAFDAVLDEMCGPDPFVRASSTSEDGFAIVSATPITPATAELLERVLAFYGEFAARNRGNPALAREAAIAHRRVGDIQQLLFRAEAAESAYRTARELWDSAADDDPVERAVLENQLGRLLLETGRFEDALECHDAALAALDTVPPNAATELERARTHNAIGVALELALRRPPDGPRRGPRRGPPPRLQPQSDPLGPVREQHEQALAILTPLLGGGPPDPEVRLAIARTQRLLAAATRRPDGRGVRPEHDASIAILEELVAEFPEDRRFRFELADTLLAGSGRGRPGERPGPFDDRLLADLTRAESMFAALAAEQPSVPGYRAGQAEALHALGEYALRRGDRAGAEASIGTAYALWSALVAEQPEKPRTVHEWAKAARSLHQLLIAAGRLEESRDLVQACLEETEHLPSRHETGRALGALWLALANSLDALGDREGAERARGRVRELMRRR